MERRAVELHGPTSRSDRYCPIAAHPTNQFAHPVRLQSFRRILRPTNDPPDRLLKRPHLQHLPIQRQVRHNLLQPAVLVFDLLQPFHLRRQQPGILLLPVEIGRRSDPAFRQISATGVPSSPCLMMNAFCASVNFDAFIRFRSSPSQESVAENSSFKRSSLRGLVSLLKQRNTAPSGCPWGVMKVGQFGSWSAATGA